jgi:hypothetical protein
MARNGQSLPPNQQKALLALLEFPTTTAAAEAAGVGHRSLTRWLAEDEDFKQTLVEAQKCLLDMTITRLSRAGPMAADVLAEIACDKEAPPSVRVQAASRILSEQRAGMNIGILNDELDEIKRTIDEHEKRS